MRNGDDLNAVFENSVNEIERKLQENKAPLTFPCYGITFRRFGDALDRMLNFSHEFG